MKIGIDISQIVYPGGVGVYLKNLINNLLRIDHQNQYLIFGTSLRKHEVLKKSFSNLRLQKKYCSLPLTLAEILFNKVHFPPIEVFTGKLDVLHTSDWIEPRASCPKVTTVHDLAPVIYPQLHDSKIVTVFKRKLELVKKESALIIAVSKSTKKDLMDRMGIEEKRIKVVYEAVSDDFLRTKAEMDLIKKHRLKKFILSDAIKNPRKNLKHLLEAFIQVKDKDLTLVLTGEPMWDKKQMFELINSSGVKDKITHLSYVSLAQLKGLYKNALTALFPSFYEGFGLSVLEAMSSGCPVITTNVSSLPEVAGKAAILVDPQKDKEIARAIDNVVSSKRKRESLRRAGLEQVKRFSWKKCAQETLEIYQSLNTKY